MAKVISIETHNVILKLKDNEYSDKRFNLFIISFLSGAAVCGILILLITQHKIQEARLEAYEKCLDAEKKMERAEKIISKNRIKFLKNNGLV